MICFVQRSFLFAPFALAASWMRMFGRTFTEFGGAGYHGKVLLHPSQRSNFSKMRSRVNTLRFVPVGIFCFCLASTVLLAQAPSPAAGLTENPVYTKNCAKCHGKTAEGRHFGGPSLFSEKTAAASDGDLNNIISNGRGRMPKYAGKLTPDEIDTLVRQIRALQTKGGAKP
jgi:hypothetical protein